LDHDTASPGFEQEGEGAQLDASLHIESVANRLRYGFYSRVRIAIQLDRYQKDLGAVWWANIRQTGEFPMSIFYEAGPLFPR
jgi:hypothetical protein